MTRIGRNSGSVLAVMETLVHFGAPEGILVDGKPHLGTDRLVPLLRNFRQHLQQLGVTIKFGTRVDDLLVDNAQVVGVKVSDSADNSQKWGYDAVVLAVGHSARDFYQTLLSHNIDLIPKDFAVSYFSSSFIWINGTLLSSSVRIYGGINPPHQRATVAFLPTSFPILYLPDFWHYYRM